MRMRILIIVLGIFMTCSSVVMPMESYGAIDDEHLVKSGGEELYIKVRGQDSDNPVLLFLHGGPGEMTGPLIFQAYAGPELEKHFIVGYLHQRNTCKSPVAPVATFTAKQIVEDVHNVVQFLREKYDKDKIFLLGHSFGGILGFMYLLEYEDAHNIERFVTAGSPFSAVSLEENGYKTALNMAEKTDNQQALERLKTLGPPPYGTFKEGMVWRMLIMNMLNAKGEGATKNLQMPKVLSVTGIENFAPAWQQKAMAVAGAMWTKLSTLNLEEKVKTISIPVLMIAGAKDIMVPFSLMKKGYANLAGEKEYFILEKSDHFMFVDEPDLFVSKVLEFFQR